MSDYELTLDDERMLDNAACASQSRELLEDVTREAVARNIIRPLRDKLATLRAAAESAQCSCSIPERESGHILECWMPDLLEALERSR